MQSSFSSDVAMVEHPSSPSIYNTMKVNAAIIWHTACSVSLGLLASRLEVIIVTNYNLP